jgi:hypothetical protein
VERNNLQCLQTIQAEEDQIEKKRTALFQEENAIFFTTRWIFKAKINSENQITKLQIRLVVLGCYQSVKNTDFSPGVNSGCFVISLSSRIIGFMPQIVRMPFLRQVSQQKQFFQEHW